MLARPDPDVKIWLSKGLNPSLYSIFHGDFEKKTLEKRISKQMKVYEQITFFHKKSKFLKICLPDRKIDFLRGGPIFGEIKREPEPGRTGTGPNRNRTEPEPTETEPNRTEPWPS